MSRPVTFCYGAIAGSLCTCANFVPIGAPAGGMFLAGLALSAVTLSSLIWDPRR